MAGCAGMDAFDAEAPPLCRQHSERDHVVPADAKALHVPPIALPPQHFAWTAALLPPARAQHYEDIPPFRSDPPPARRFCSLQI